MNKKIIRTLIYSAVVICAICMITACSTDTKIKYVQEEVTTATPLPLIIPFVPENTALPIEEKTYKQDDGRTADDIIISEISSAGQDWIEFFNQGTSAIDLADYYIGFSEDFAKAKQLPHVTVAPAGYCCVYGRGSDQPVKADFAISKAGETLHIFRTDGSVVISITVPALSKNVSLIYVNGAWEYTYLKTPGYRNSDSSFTSLKVEEYENNCPLYISEVLVSNKHSVLNCYSEYSDFVEICNSSDRSISLSGWFLSDSLESPAKWAFPNISIAPGEFLTVFLSGHESTENELHASFSLNPDESVVLFNGNENKYLIFNFPSELIPDISVGPDHSYYRFPTPGYENSTAISDISNIGFFFADDIFISEVCGFGDDTDWIEIYNGSDTPINVSDWKLTDDLSEPDKYIFPSITLNPHDYYVVKASSHPSEQNSETVKMGISLSGEKIYLIDSKARVRDVFKTGMLEDVASSGRIENRADISRVFFAVATPGKKNSSSYSTGRTSEPIFSNTSLYCTEPFTLELTAENGADIYYSSDGSTPKASTKQLYTGPIHISKNTVIRAVAAKEGLLNSNIATYTYLFEDAHSIPVICVSLSPSDKDAVWSAKSKQSKTKVEREGYLSFYEADGRLGVSFPAGFKPKGAGTLGRSQASLSIHLRGMYGQSKVTYPFFSEYGWDSFASLVIRNAGQDYQKGRIRDSLASRICFGLNIDVSATRPVAVYVNGKYYGLYDLNEDQNADFLNTHYGIDQKTVEIIRFNTVAVKGSNANWKKVIDFAKSKNFKSNDVFDEFTKWVDEEYFMDYLVCSIYLCNSDMANQKYWHSTDNSLKWRPIFYDFDYAIGFNRSAKSSILERFFDPDGTATATSRIYTYIACALIQNPEWRQRFIDRYIELTYTVFDPDRVNGIIDQLVSEMESEMPRHIAKWGSRNAPASVKEWHQNIDDIKNWFAQRQKYAVDSLKKYFRLSESDVNEIVKRYRR